MAKLRALVFTFALASMPLSFASSGAAQSDEELARQLFETGRSYFDRAEYEKAAEAFAEAYALSQRPALLVNQARAVEALGRFDESVALLEKAAVELPEHSELLPSIESRLRRLRAQAERAEPAEEAAETDGLAAEEPSREAQVRGAHSSRGALFWSGASSVGFGAASLVVALATGLRSRGIAGDLDAACPGDVCDPSLRGDISRGDRLAVASTATLVVGAAASVTGVVLMLVAPEIERDGVELTGGPGELGAGLRVRF